MFAFLSVPGAPIDNIQAERVLKRFVLFRTWRSLWSHRDAALQRLPHSLLPLQEMYTSLLIFPGPGDPAIYRADQHTGRNALRLIAGNYCEDVKDLILLTSRPFAYQTTFHHRAVLLTHGDLNRLLHRDVRLFGQLGLSSGHHFSLQFTARHKFWIPFPCFPLRSQFFFRLPQFVLFFLFLY